MDKNTVRRLIAILDAGQEERGAGLDITAERYLDIAAGAPLTGAEAQIVLGSPLARKLLRIAGAYTAATTETQAPAAPLVFVPRLLAAQSTDREDTPFELELRGGEEGELCAILTATPGFGGALGWRLKLQLVRPAWPGSIVDGITVTIAEPGPEAFVWLRGTTDAEGVVRAAWPAGEPSPRVRLQRMAAQRLTFVLG